MLKPYSTKRGNPVPPEFEPIFVNGGWARVNLLFGKRPAVRYFTALGPERLALLRLVAVRKQREWGQTEAMAKHGVRRG